MSGSERNLPGRLVLLLLEAAVQKFFINFRTADGISKDDEGIDLPNLEAAREEALTSIREVTADSIKAGRANQIQAAFITDANGQELMTIPVAEALPRLQSLNSRDEEYRRQAAEAQAMSESSISVVDQEAWLRIARGYMNLVRKPPQTATKNFDDEVDKHGTKQEDSDKSH
jgi:hypothetical protein